MNVAFFNDAVYPYSKGGVEKRIHDLAEGLARHGVSSEVVGPAPRERAQSDPPIGLDPVGDRPPVRHGAGPRRSGPAISFALRAFAVMMRCRADVVEVQSSSPLAAIGVCFAARLRRRGVVMVWHEFWGDYWLEYAGPLRGRLIRLVERLCLYLPALHVSVSELTRERVQSARRIPVLHVPIGIDVGHVQRVAPSDDRFDVLYVGRLVRQKCPHLVLNAVKHLSDNGRSPRVGIIGDGPEGVGLRDMAVEWNLQHVHFLGRIESDDQKIALIKSARLLVQPSPREGFGLSVLEAAACGVPSIVADTPTNAAVSLAHPSCRVPLSAHAFGRAIAELLESELSWKRAQEYAVGVANSHPMTAQVTQMLRIYHNAARAA